MPLLPPVLSRLVRGEGARSLFWGGSTHNPQPCRPPSVGAGETVNPQPLPTSVKPLEGECPRQTSDLSRDSRQATTPRVSNTLHREIQCVSAFERRGNNFTGIKAFYLKDKAKKGLNCLICAIFSGQRLRKNPLKGFAGHT